MVPNQATTFEELNTADRCIYAMARFYAGFFTISQFHQFCTKHGLSEQALAEAEEEVSTAIIAGMVPVIEGEGLLSGTEGKKFVWNADDLVFYTLNNSVKELWHIAEGTPESTVQALDESHGSASFVEEYGFIEFDGVWVGRTVRDVYAMGTDGLTRVMSRCAVAIPKPSSAEEFLQEYKAITSIDGGVRFYGDVTMVNLSPESSKKYGLDADNVFLLTKPQP